MIIDTCGEAFTKANKKTVRTHGDLNPDNILVDEQGTLWFIDFEYGHATTAFLDFGKFLRERKGFSHYITPEVLSIIKNGYHDPLRENWVHLSKLVDIPVLMRIISLDKYINASRCYNILKVAFLIQFIIFQCFRILFAEILDDNIV